MPNISAGFLLLLFVWCFLDTTTTTLPVETGSHLRSSGCPGNHYVDQAGPIEISLLLPPSAGIKGISHPTHRIFLNLRLDSCVTAEILHAWVISQVLG